MVCARSGTFLWDPAAALPGISVCHSPERRKKKVKNVIAIFSMRLNVSAILCLVLLCTLPFAAADLSEWHNSPRTGTDIGDIFRLKFEIMADETGNYTITLIDSAKFSPINGSLSKTISIPAEETRTFVFDMRVDQTLDDGKHLIRYETFKNGERFKEGKAYVRAGKQAPGFELLALAGAGIGAALLVRKKRR
jgi:hypothetical protein